MNVFEIPATPAARALLQDSREQAKKLHRNYVGTEHLLLAICDNTELVSQLKESLGFKRDEIRDALLQELTDVHRVVCSSEGDIPFTPRVKKIAALAAKIAREQFYSAKVDSLHLFLGILLEGQGLASKVLATFDIRYHQSMTNVLKMTFPENPVATEIDGMKVCSTKQFDVGNGYRLIIQSLHVPTDPVIHVYSIELRGSSETWRETVATVAEVDAFVRGMELAMHMCGKVLPTELLGMKPAPAPHP